MSVNRKGGAGKGATKRAVAAARAGKRKGTRAGAKRVGRWNLDNTTGGTTAATGAAGQAFDPEQPGDSLGVPYQTLLQAVSLVTAGLPTAAVARLQRTSGLTQERIQQVAGISRGSFARRKQKGRLSREESERLLRVSRIFEHATSLFDGDASSATVWLETPVPALGDQRPLDLARTEPGAREVEDLIGRIGHGVVFLMPVAYRISKAAYAGSIWSGTGARDYGGRWNSKGVAVVYTAESRSLTAIEQLVHMVKPRVLRGYVIASITFDEARVRRVNVARLPPDWNAPVAPPELKPFGDEWVAAGRHPVLGVPSAVIPGEWNYLFNPAHPEFDGFAKAGPVPFVYDVRLR